MTKHDYDDDGAELVKQVLTENPPDEQGVREEWERHVGWHEKYNTLPQAGHQLDPKQNSEQPNNSPFAPLDDKLESKVEEVEEVNNHRLKDDLYYKEQDFHGGLSHDLDMEVVHSINTNNQQHEGGGGQEPGREPEEEKGSDNELNGDKNKESNPLTGVQRLRGGQQKSEQGKADQQVLQDDISIHNDLHHQDMKFQLFGSDYVSCFSITVIGVIIFYSLKRIIHRQQMKRENRML
jgi:hypothetical protein